MKNVPARLWIYPAKEARVALVVRRKPHQTWHFLRWDTGGDVVESGAWAQGLFYPKGCDVSWDGRWWTYYGDAVSGLAPIASLDALATWESYGAWDGGGFFDQGKVLRIPPPISGARRDAEASHLLPFRIGALRTRNVLESRLKRDGWRHSVHGGALVQQPTPSHPRLHKRDAFSAKRGYVSSFSLPDYPKLLDEGVFWATYDSVGELLVARRGILERYTLRDLEAGRLAFAFDLNSLLPPENLIRV